MIQALGAQTVRTYLLHPGAYQELTAHQRRCLKPRNEICHPDVVQPSANTALAHCRSYLYSPEMQIARCGVWVKSIKKKRKGVCIWVAEEKGGHHGMVWASKTFPELRTHRFHDAMTQASIRRCRHSSGGS